MGGQVDADLDEATSASRTTAVRAGRSFAPAGKATRDTARPAARLLAMVAVTTILGGLGLGYAGLAAGMYLGQRRLMYPRSRGTPDPADVVLPGLDVISTRSHDGLSLRHWYVPPPPGGTVVAAFHGNAGDVAERADKLRPLVKAGFGLLLAEYRGYGGNPGRPNEPDLIRDGHDILDWLAGQGVPPDRTSVYGESLGTGVAVALAAARPVGTVVLDAPFTSVAEVAQAHYWWLPARWLVRDRFDSLARIKHVTVPKLILHGGRDTTIPPRFGRSLFEAAPEPKRWRFFEQGAHVDLFDHGAAEAVVAFLRAQLAVHEAAAPVE